MAADRRRGRQGADGAERVACALLDGRRSLDGRRVALLVSPGAPFVECLFGVPARRGVRRRAVASAPRSPRDRLLSAATPTCKPSSASPPRQRVAFLAPERRIVTTDALTGPLRRALASAPSRARGRRAAALYERHDGQAQGGHHHARQPRRSIMSCSPRLGVARRRRSLAHAPLHHLHGLGIAMLFPRSAPVRPPASSAAHLTRQRLGRRWRRRASSMGVPTVHAKLFAAFDDADDATPHAGPTRRRTLRLVTSGSAALPVSVGERWAR